MKKRKAVSAKAKPNKDKREVPELAGMISLDPSKTFEPKTSGEKLITQLLRP